MKENILQTKSEKFAIRIVKLSEDLLTKKQLVISNQILKSGTSIGANIAESIYSASKNDLINKLSIAQKEASETKFWLKLLQKTNYINENLYLSFLEDVEELLKLLASSIKTCRKNLD